MWCPEKVVYVVSREGDVCGVQRRWCVWCPEQVMCVVSRAGDVCGVQRR